MNKITKPTLIAILVLVVVGVSFTVWKNKSKTSETGSETASSSDPSSSGEGTSGTGDAADADSENRAAKKVNPEELPGAPVEWTGGTVVKKDGSAGNSAAPGAGSTGGMAPGAPGAGSDGTTAAVPAKPENNCFTYEYRHQKEALNKDIEDFLDYANAFPVPHDKISQKSVCVKVNGRPTAFKLVKNTAKDGPQQEIVIGSVVGPESLVKVSYCLGDAPCKESCAVKTNRLMDDLMSDAGDEDEFKESWGEAKEQKKELQAKVKEFRNIASQNRDLQKQATIREWDTVGTNEWLCKK